MRFLLEQVTRERHPTIGWAIVARLNEYGPGVRVVGIVYHPEWRPGEELAEILLEVLTDGD